jgi:hypothetical protein
MLEYHLQSFGITQQGMLEKLIGALGQQPSHNGPDLLDGDGFGMVTVGSRAGLCIANSHRFLELLDLV